MARMRMQRVVLRQALLDPDVLAARVPHIREEEQALVGVVAASEQRRALVAAGRGEPDVGVGRQLLEDRRVVEACAAERRARGFVTPDDLLLLVLGELRPAVEDLDVADDQERAADHPRALAAADPDVAIEVARATQVERAVAETQRTVVGAGAPLLPAGCAEAAEHVDWLLR